MYKFILFFILAVKSFSYIQISPIILDKQIDKGGSNQEFFITNSTSKDVAYRIYKEKSDNGYDMTSFLEYYPKTLKLKPGETDKIKIYIQSPTGSPNGEYTTLLGIKEIPTIQSKNQKKSGLILYKDLKIELAGFVGDSTPKLKIKKEFLKDRLSFNISNFGKTRTKVEVFLKSDNKELLFLDSFRLLSETSKNYNKKIDLRKFKNPRLLIFDMNGKEIKES